MTSRSEKPDSPRARGGAPRGNKNAKKRDGMRRVAFNLRLSPTTTVLILRVMEITGENKTKTIERNLVPALLAFIEENGQKN